MSNDERLVYIDYLKVLGLFLVILAHVDCPNWLMQIRSFDVPLLVFISGYLASQTFKTGNNKRYFFKRIIRLAVPSWIFLTFFFIVQSLVYSRPSVDDIIKGILFLRDANMVGMLWVIWVFIVCALLIPLINKIGFNNKIIIILICLMIVFELTCIFTDIEQNRILYISVLTIVPWGTLTYFAFYYDRVTYEKSKYIAVICILIFIVAALILAILNGQFILTNDYKYPARIYYMCFAIPIVIFLIEKARQVGLKRSRGIIFISKASLWIYLWHILVLYFVKSIIIDDDLWLLQYILIIIIAISITVIQNKGVKMLIDRFEMPFLKIFLG